MLPHQLKTNTMSFFCIKEAGIRFMGVGVIILPTVKQSMKIV